MNEEQTSQHPATRPTLGRDAIGLLTDDHRNAQELFGRLALLQTGSNTSDEKFTIAKQVCGDLLIHMAIEEAIFYPRVRDALHDDGMVDAAEHDHDGAKELIRRIGEIDPADPLFDTSMESLANHVLEHVEQEETVVFPKMLLAQTDLIALGEELAAAKSMKRVNLGLQSE